MQEAVIFSFTHPDGCIAINVGNFFGTADAVKTKKMLKLMRLNCSEEQREQLLLSLIEEDRRRHDTLEALKKMEYEREQMLADYFSSPCGKIQRDAAWPEKALARQREKIAAVINTVKVDRWYP